MDGRCHALLSAPEVMEGEFFSHFLLISSNVQEGVMK